MLNIFVSIIYAALIGLNIYLSIHFIMNAKGSRLYNTVSTFGILSAMITGLQLASMYIDIEMLDIYYSVLLSLLALVLYFVWQTTYNQINKNHYSMFIVLLLSLSVITKLLVHYKVVEFPILTLISNYELINILALFMNLVFYYKFKNQNKTHEVNFIPLVILILIMSIIIMSISTGFTTQLFSIIFAISNIAILLIYRKDYKNSFYY